MKIEKLLNLAPGMTSSREVILNILYTNNTYYEKSLVVLKPFDISLEQYNVLRILKAQKGKPISMGEIQKRMIAKTSNTTRLVDKLLAKKFVDRYTCEDNRRKILVTITSDGLSLLEHAELAVYQMEDQFTNKLSISEHQKLVELLEKLRQ